MANRINDKLALPLRNIPDASADVHLPFSTALDKFDSRIKDEHNACICTVDDAKLIILPTLREFLRKELEPLYLKQKEEKRRRRRRGKRRRRRKYNCCYNRSKRWAISFPCGLQTE